MVRCRAIPLLFALASLGEPVAHRRGVQLHSRRNWPGTAAARHRRTQSRQCFEKLADAGAPVEGGRGAELQLAHSAARQESRPRNSPPPELSGILREPLIADFDDVRPDFLVIITHGGSALRLARPRRRRLALKPGSGPPTKIQFAKEFLRYRIGRTDPFVASCRRRSHPVACCAEMDSFARSPEPS